MEHFEPYLNACLKRFPILEKTGIRKFFAGPESFTPDTNSLLGEVPEVKNFFVCCGLNSIGIASAGGVGKVTAEWMMNGGIETDLSITCIDKNYFRVVSSAATREHDKLHIQKYLSDKVVFNDVTEVFCCFGLFGPKSRDMMVKLSKDDFTNESFKFGTAKLIKIGEIEIWAQRLSYVGELGYELYVKSNNAKKLYSLIIMEGKNFQMSHCGMHAMDIMRMESGFLHWGHDISPEENQYQAGLSFAISTKKDDDFIGKKALEKFKKLRIKNRFVMFTLKNSKPGEPLLLHDEPIYLEDKIIGRSTSGNYSFNFKKNLVFGYITTNFSNDELKNKSLFIEVEKKKYSIELISKPLKQTNFKKN